MSSAIKAVAKLASLTANPYAYATWDDVLEIMPNLTDNEDAERIFNLFLNYSITAMVDPGLVTQWTFILSLNLLLHFMVEWLKGVESQTFKAADWLGKAGPIIEMVAEKVSLKFANSYDDPWETNLSQTEFGQEYLIIIRFVRTIIGIDGQGNLWASI